MILSFVLFACCIRLQQAYGDVKNTSLKISGSSTIQPLAEMMADLYRSKYGLLSDVQGGGTSRGIKNALSGDSDIGTASRALSKDEKLRLDHTTIGFDAVAIIVNSRNPLTGINKETVNALYQGKINNWKGLTGWDQPVALVSKQPGRSTLELFEDYTGLRHRSHSAKGPSGLISEKAHEIGSNLEGATLVGGIPGAIGYVSVGTALSLIGQGMPIKVLALDGAPATKENVLNRKYPILRELNLVYKKGNALIRGYVDLFMGHEGQLLVEDNGFIPVRKIRAGQ
ncbi:MAG: phosphate ABC transporter substrate-binding protein [Deltaproteobacteria bacterium]|nr:phosphate ABC transporter substrate-binding protein [Deltaproteobacteria bacterium]